MTPVAISAHEISKGYRRGAYQDGATLRDVITRAPAWAWQAVQSAFRRPVGGAPEDDRKVWALKDVSFEIRKGEVVGIIGPNGAGKSTLLKILSRITEPTSGYADVTGKVGSLLEVGLQFHQELTGRENVYLTGAMLGMKQSEVRRKFDSIVEFSEVAKFVDTPVKYYSTGMGMRLAFSVAAHLEPEILLVDEVLAVGDLAFQRKCLRKMESVAAHGRTVLFVSHNLAAMQELCESAIVLIGGQMVFRGSILDGISLYNRRAVIGDVDKIAPAGKTQWRQVSINAHGRGVVVGSSAGSPFFADAVFELASPERQCRFACSLENARGEIVLEQAIEHRELGAGVLLDGLHELRVSFPALWLAPGLYTLYFKYTGSELGDILWSSPAMMSISGGFGIAGGGILAPPLEWRLMSDSSATRELVS